MLYRVFLPPFSQGEDYILKKIQEAFSEKKKVFVLVPEQATALYERAVVSLCGNTASWSIEVTNFSRLPDVVLREYGSLSGKAPTSAEKKMILADLIHSMKDSFTALSVREDADSVSALEAEFDSMRLAGLWSKDLASLAEKDMPSEEMKAKFSDVALLTAAYSEKIKEKFSDPAEEGEKLARILKEYPFFRDSVVVVDGFWDFTHPQRLILEEILKQAENTFVTFTARKKETLLFSKPLLAARDLLMRAGKHGVQTQDISFDLREEDTPLCHLAKHFFYGGIPFEKNADGIELWECKNAGEESEFVANRILRLVRQGAHYNEIAVLSRDGAGEEILSLTLKEKGIPYFLEEKAPLFRTPLARTVFLACRFALGLGTESDLRFFLKNGVFSLADEKRFCLERYVATWSLTPKKLLGTKPFTMHPEGYVSFREPYSEENEDRKELALVNFVREEVFSPIRDLALILTKGSVSERICGIVAYLSRIGAESLLGAKIKEAKEKGDFEEAAEICAVWNSLLEALSAFGKALGEEECDGERFLSLLEIALSGNLPGSLPPAQDRVQIGRVNFSRTKNTKYVFITGLSAGSFPAPPGKGGLFPEREKDFLREKGFQLPGGENSIADEYFYFYLAALSGERGLFLSYKNEESETDGAALSVIGKRMLTLFPRLELRIFSSETQRPLTPKDAFVRYLSDENAFTDSAALRRYFLKDPRWKEKILSSAEGLSFEEMRDTLPTQKPYKGRDMSMVYTRLEKYILCPFSYFARYLLNAKDRKKATLGANVSGSLVHSVLEKVLLSLQQKGKNIGELTSAELSEENRLAVREATLEILGEEVPDSVLYLLGQLEESTLLILKHLQKEFSLSGFRPIFFEKKLAELDSVYKIPLSDGTELCLYGSIDRVDLYENKKGEKFVRVVDYKTGGHDFSLTAVANGLSLQMLIYLFAMWSCGFSYGDEKIKPLPAAVLYLNGLNSSFVCDTPEEEDKVNASPFLALSREGLVVDDRELLAAQDPEGMGEFIPVAWNKEKVTGAANLISLENLGKLKKKVEKDFLLLAENLKDGRIAASPLVSRSGQVDACRWCEFFPVCKRKPEDVRPYRTRISQSEIFGEEEE